MEKNNTYTTDGKVKHLSSEEDIKEQVDLLIVKLKDFVAIEKLAVS